jgi:hypothetical protein
VAQIEYAVIELLIAVACAIVAFNLFVSLRVLRDDLPPLQRGGQLAVVWLVPILGALLAFTLQQKSLTRGSGRYPAEPNAGDDFGESGKSVSSFTSRLDHGDSGAANNNVDAATDP